MTLVDLIRLLRSVAASQRAETMESAAFTCPVTTGAWQQTDLLGALGALEPLPRDRAAEAQAARPADEPVAQLLSGAPSGEVRFGERLESHGTAEERDAAPAAPVAPQRPIPAAAARPAMAAAATAAPAVLAPAVAEIPLDPLPAPPETLLILDTETTALSPEDGQCIEVGAVLFQVSHRAVLTQVSFLLPCDRNPAEPVNGIPAEVTRLPHPWQAALACFEAMADQADAVLAHNSSFDRQWFGQAVLPRIDKPWICSMDDIRWPAALGLRSAPSLQSLALAYGVPVWAAHRALTDCTYLVQVFQRCGDLERLLAAALEPRSLMRAEVSYANRHLAREAGFRWDKPVPRAWSRRLSQREARSLPFAVRPVEAGLPVGQAL